VALRRQVRPGRWVASLTGFPLEILDKRRFLLATDAMAIQAVRANFGLDAAGIADRTLISGAVTLGRTPQSMILPNGTTLFPCRVLLGNGQSAVIDATDFSYTDDPPDAAELLLNPTGDDNDILLTADAAGFAGNSLTGAIAVAEDSTALTAVKTGNDIVITSGDKRRMIVTGTLEDEDENPVAFPGLVFAGADDDFDYWTNTGSIQTNSGVEYVVAISASTAYVGKFNNGIPSYLSVGSATTVDFPDEVSPYNTPSPGSGVPTVTAAPATAAQAIAAINAASLGVTASNGPDSDGSGAIAAVAQANLTGGTNGAQVLDADSDFQGNPYPAANDILGLLVQCVSGSGTVAVATDFLAPLKAGSKVQIACPDGIAELLDEITLTASEDGTECLLAIVAS
jgi:hypothetical protein